MEASALQLQQGLARGEGSLSRSLLRLRSDEQLVTVFRAGNHEAFQVIHDRYRKRLFGYIARMLAGSGQDAEDVLQEVFERAFAGLRSGDGELALRAWLYRVAHNRCIDHLRQRLPLASAEPDVTGGAGLDPIAAAEQRETIRRLIVDVRRLPEQQRSALLLREMSGMSYSELAGALGVSVPAVKSLLVRARIGLVAALEARDAACSQIREEIVLCQDRGVRPTGLARRHMRDCQQCREFRRSLRGASRSLAMIAPTLGPLGLLVKLLGGGAAGSGAVGSTGAVAGGGTAATGGAAAGSALASSGAIAAGGALGTGGVVAGGLAAGSVGHVATLLAAAIITAGGAVAIPPVVSPGGSGRPSPTQHQAASTGNSAPAPPLATSYAGRSANFGLADPSETLTDGARARSAEAAVLRSRRLGTASSRHHRAKTRRTGSATGTPANALPSTGPGTSSADSTTITSPSTSSPAGTTPVSPTSGSVGGGSSTSTAPAGGTGSASSGSASTSTSVPTGGTAPPADGTTVVSVYSASTPSNG